MKNWFINNFGFSKREYNGLLALLVLLLALTLTPTAYRYYFNKHEAISQYEKLALQKLILTDRYDRKRNGSGNEDFEDRFSKINKKPNYHVFDPNTIGEKEWQQFGLSPKQAMSIVNYVKKGGHFYKPEDLQKMYTISPDKYQALLPYVEIKQLNKPNAKPFKKSRLIKKE